MKKVTPYLVSGAGVLAFVWVAAAGAHYGPTWTEMPWVVTGLVGVWGSVVLPLWWDERR